LKSGLANDLSEGETAACDPLPPKEYELISILMHSGSAHAGHYFCYVKDTFVHPNDLSSDAPVPVPTATTTEASSQWLLFNDSTVTTITQEQLEIILGAPKTDSSASAPAPGSTKSSDHSHPVVPSANNAYMLVYRLLSPINVHDIRSSLHHLPEDLVEEIQKENVTFLEAKAKYEHERAFLHLAVSPSFVGIQTQQPADLEAPKKSSDAPKYKIFRIHETSTLEQLTTMVYHEFFPSQEGARDAMVAGATPRREDVRLRVYDSIKGTLLPPMALFAKSVLDQFGLHYPSEDHPPILAEESLLPSQSDMEAMTTLEALPETTLKRVFHLEVKQPDESFSIIGSGQGISLSLELCLYLPHSEGEMERNPPSTAPQQSAFSSPFNLTIRSNQTLDQLLDAISAVFSPHFSQWSTSAEQEQEDGQHEFLVSNVVIVKHDISTGLARALYPSKTSVAITRSSPLSAILSNNDRLYVDLDSSFHKQGSSTSSSNDTLRSVVSKNVILTETSTSRLSLMEYFERIFNEITIQFTNLNQVNATSAAAAAETEPSSRCPQLPRLDLRIDRRSSMRLVKEKLSSVLDLPMASFVLLRGADGDNDPHLEIKNLNLSLAENGLQDGSYLRLSYGAPLVQGEYRVNLLRKSLVSVDQQISRGGYDGVVDQVYERLGSTVIRSDQTIESFKRWCQETYFPSQQTSPPSLRIQFTQLVDTAESQQPEKEEQQLEQQKRQQVQPSQSYKAVYALSDSKTFQDCLGNQQLRDGIYLTITDSVPEVVYNDSNDLLVALWEWITVWPRQDDNPNPNGFLVYHDEVVLNKDMSFEELAEILRQDYLPKSHPASGAALPPSGQEERALYYAKPFTWQLRDLSNLPSLKWSTQPDSSSDNSKLSGPPYRLRNTPHGGSAALLFHFCAPEEHLHLIQQEAMLGANAESSSSSRDMETSFRLYTATEQSTRKREEDRADAERKQLLEDKLKLIQGSLLQKQTKGGGDR
jgi:hypothetical protein